MQVVLRPPAEEQTWPLLLTYGRGLALGHLDDGTPTAARLLGARLQWIPSFNLYRGLYELSQVRPHAHGSRCHCKCRRMPQQPATCEFLQAGMLCCSPSSSPLLAPPCPPLQYAFLADRTGGTGLTWSKLSDPE